MFWQFYEKAVESIFINPVRKWYSFQPTPSRWGSFSFLTSICFFLFSISAAAYAVYISIVGGTIMLPISANVLLIITIVIFGGAFLFGIAAFILAIYFLRTQGKDPQLILFNRLITELQRQADRDKEGQTEKKNDNSKQ